MKRRTLDLLLSWTGLVVAVVLVTLGGLLMWGSTFVNDQVHDQLAAQKIFFPPAGSDAIKGPQFAGMRQYASQQLTNGAQAQTYANDFIAIHLSEVAGGKTYAQVSAEVLADPKNTTLRSQADTLFRGTTLRGLLLNAYAFSRAGQIAGAAAVVSFVGAAAMLVLSALGFVHASRRRAGVAPSVSLGERAGPQESKAA
jgi:hypothetical protein